MADFINKFNLSGTYIPIQDARLDTDVLVTLKGKNLVVFGDSWAYGTGSTTNAPPGATYENSRFCYAVAEALEMNEYNYAVGGAGFMRTDQIIDQVTAADSAMSDEEKADTKIVLLIAGVNDIRNTGSETLSDVTDQVLNVINNALSVFENAYVIFGVNGPASQITDTMWYWVSAMAETALTNRKRVQYIDVCSNMSSRTDLYVTNDFHPNWLGHQMLAGLIVSSILGSTGLPMAYLGTVTLNTGYTVDGGGLHLFKVGPLVMLTPGRIVIASAQQQTGNRQIGTLPVGAAGPTKNCYSPVFNSNNVSGACAMVGLKFYLNTNSADSAAYVPSIIWLPYD